MKMSLNDFLTKREIQSAMALYATAEPGTFATLCEEQIIRPVIERIDKRLGQANDPRFLAYAVEYVMMMATSNKGDRAEQQQQLRRRYDKLQAESKTRTAEWRALARLLRDYQGEI